MTLSPIDGLRCPPFGIGGQRRVSEHLTGVTSTGVPYQGFNYTSSAYDLYAGVATVRLAMCLPPFFVSLPDHPRDNITGMQIPNQVGMLVVAADVAYGQAVLEGSLMALREFARHRPLDLAIDGDSLTAIQVPLGAEALRAYCEDMAMVAQTISGNQALRQFQVPREPGQGFYGYPGSMYVERDDRLLADAPVTRVGSDHQAIAVIAMPPYQGLQAVGFTHTYQTTSYDGTTTTTQTHQEHLVSLRLPFAFGRLGVDWRGPGRPDHAVRARVRAEAPGLRRRQPVRRRGRTSHARLDHAHGPAGLRDPGLGHVVLAPHRPHPAGHAVVRDASPWSSSTTWSPAVWQKLGYPGNPMTLDLR